MIMPNILKYFGEWLNETILVYKPTTTANAGTGLKAKSWVLLETIVNCAFFERSSAKNFISGKFKEETDGVLVINKENIINEIKGSYKIVLQARGSLPERVFKAVHADNVFNENQVYNLEVKEY